MDVRERFAHLSYMHRGSAVSIMEPPAHLSQMHQGPWCGCRETTRTGLSHTLELALGAVELLSRVSYMH